jgi:transposase
VYLHFPSSIPASQTPGDAGGGHARKIEKLHKIGQLIVEQDFLAKKSGRSARRTAARSLTAAMVNCRFAGSASVRHHKMLPYLLRLGNAAAFGLLVATTPVDFRRSADSFVALVRDQLKHDPFSGTIFVFRSKRADRLKS